MPNAYAPVHHPGIFWHTPGATFSSLARPTRRKASLADLPIELLAAIIGEVYRSCASDGSTRKWSPRSLARVCSFWKAATLATPEFWTRLTISLHNPHLSVAWVTSNLVRSRNLIIERVNVVGTTGFDINRERARVMMVMQAIASHMHRCRDLVFRVRFRSCLPSFPSHFLGNAKHLRSLDLLYSEDDGGATTPVSATNLSLLHREPFQCSNLRKLVIDGRNYFNACQQDANWTRMIPTLSILSISHFTPDEDCSESFTLSEFLLSLLPFRHHLTYLSIDDLEVDDSPTPWLGEDGSFPQLKTTALKDTTCATEILDFLHWPPDVHITRCSLDLGELNVVVGADISLKDIDKDEDLAEFLTPSVTQRLVFDSCPGFDDNLLHEMIIPEDIIGILGDSSWCCAANVEDLSIINCTGFSISALKNVVETRLTVFNHPQDDLFYSVPLKALRLSGRVPHVSWEDRKWFEARVPKFSYNPFH